MSLFNETSWLQNIKAPDWYFEVPPLIEKLRALHDSNRAQYEIEKERIYDFFEEQLKRGTITLAKSGPNQDIERKPIDTIIIHHTSGNPGLSKDRLSAIELVRLYAPHYAQFKKNKLIYSGHIRDGKQVFWPYHWIVREDGTCERLLEDHEIGWQAGNWDINCRSIAICIDDDHEQGFPTPVDMEAISYLIKSTYPQVSKDRILGHREVNPKTTCPSEFFLSVPGHKGWKDDLLSMI